MVEWVMDMQEYEERLKELDAEGVRELFQACGEYHQKHSKGAGGAAICWFEVVDASDEEAYHTLGGFPTLAEAIAAFDTACPDAEPFYCDYDRDDVIKIAIRQHTKGFGEATQVWSQEWVETYNEPKDEYEWTRVTKPAE